MTLTRMIFGVRTTDANPTQLRVRGNIGIPAPALSYRRRESREVSSVDCADGAWTLNLEQGDYVVEIQVEDWVAGRLDVTAELTTGQSSPVFVYHGPPPGSPPPPVALAAWEATALYVDPPESSVTGDPKDPWPPPPPPPGVTLAPESATWFTAELAAARIRIAEERTAGGGKGGVPADVLAALFTGS